MKSFYAAMLLFRADIRRRGAVALCLNLFAFDFLQVAIVVVLFDLNASGGVSVVIDALARAHSFIILTIALSIGFRTWEMDVISVTFDYLRISSRVSYLLTVSFFFTVLLAPSLLAVATVMFIADTLFSFADFALLVCYGVGGLFCGICIGFGRAFRHEKAINNFLYAVMWLISFGPGPVLGYQPHVWQFLFPTYWQATTGPSGVLISISVWCLASSCYGASGFLPQRRKGIVA